MCCQKQLGQSWDMLLAEIEHDEKHLVDYKMYNLSIVQLQLRQNKAQIWWMRFFSLIIALPEAEHFDVVGRLLKDVHKHCLGIVPEDFISKSIFAMQNLRANDRYNILYGLAVGLGTIQPHSH